KAQRRKGEIQASNADADPDRTSDSDASLGALAPSRDPLAPPSAPASAAASAPASASAPAPATASAAAPAAASASAPAPATADPGVVSVEPLRLREPTSERSALSGVHAPAPVPDLPLQAGEV